MRDKYPVVGVNEARPHPAAGALPLVKKTRFTRRGFLGVMTGATAGAVGFGVGESTSSDLGAMRATSEAEEASFDRTEPFFGLHQGGIATSKQAYTVFAAFDVNVARRAELVSLLRAWTGLAGNLATGRGTGGDGGVADSGEILGLGPARLTINFGFGPSLFGGPAGDRFGLSKAQPWQLTALPTFPGDAIEPSDSGGDLSLHACAEDPQVAFHAIRTLIRDAGERVSLRWAQSGFDPSLASSGTPRNLMGFKDGTMNPRGDSELDDYVWVGGEGPGWMTGGTFLVVRRIKMDLQAWDQLSVSEQERIIGRHKLSGAPLGDSGEFDPLDLEARDASGAPTIPRDAHVRLAAPGQNWGSVILRRSYNYVDDQLSDVTGASQVGEGPIDAGLLFCSYQRNPRLSFIPIYRALSQEDALRSFTTHTASGIFALPRAASDAEHWIGQSLLDT